MIFLFPRSEIHCALKCKRQENCFGFNFENEICQLGQFDSDIQDDQQWFQILTVDTPNEIVTDTTVSVTTTAGKCQIVYISISFIITTLQRLMQSQYLPLQLLQ